MAHKTSRKARPTPLKDVQFAMQPDESRRYFVLDAHSSLPSPTYPVGQHAVTSTLLSLSLHENQVRAPDFNDSPTWAPPCVVSHLMGSLPLVQVEPSAVLSSRTSKHCWSDLQDSQDDSHLDPVHLCSLQPHRSLTPPINPSVLSPPEIGTDYSSKRSGMTFALVPAEVDGKHVFAHVVTNHRGNDPKGNSSLPPISSGNGGLPEDMQDILRQLDDLASWVKTASSSRNYLSSMKSIVDATRLTGHLEAGTGQGNTSHPSSELFANKGKNRLLSTTPRDSECGACRDLVVSSRGVIPDNSTNIASGTDWQSEGFIYVPNCDTPEFLVGSSNSPVAYPVCGYSSHPSRYSPYPPGPTHNIPHHSRFLERRSTPCPSPTPPLVSSPLGRTSFRTLFQRSRCNTTAMSHPSIPSSHVPVEGALRQGKRMRLPWLKI